MLDRRVKVFKVKEKTDRYNTMVDVLCIILLPTVLFWNYLTGRYCFVFGDVASDSVSQYYPDLLHVSDRVAKGLWDTAFSFVIGLGNRESALFPGVNNWPGFFGSDNVAYLMGINIFAKMLFAGILIYGLSVLWNLKREERLIVTLGYMLNPMLTVRSAWYVYSGLALMIALWLWGFEFAYRKKNLRSFFVFALITELFFTQFDIYYCLLYGLIFFIYIICRIISDGNSAGEALFYGLINYGIFAFGGICDSIWSSLKNTVGSNRASSAYQNFISSSQRIIDLGGLYDAFIRTIGQTIEGINDEYAGTYNFLSGPAFYCGIMIALIVPVMYYNLPKRKKIPLGIGLMTAVMYISMPIIRSLSSGFLYDSYKLSSFWINVLAILVVVEGFNSIRESGYKRYSRAVFNITASFYLLLVISIWFTGRVVRKEQWLFSIIFLLLYIVLINMYFTKQSHLIKAVFLAVLVAESILISYSTVNNRGVFEKQALDWLYYNNVYSAIHETKQSDEGWYRFEACPGTMSLCDSLAQDFYGTKSYIGGTGISKSIRDYYDELGLAQINNNQSGTYGNIYAEALLDVKYTVLTDQNNSMYGMDYLGEWDNVTVFRNRLALPLGFFYNSEITYEEFQSLSTLDRNRELLKRCLVNDEIETDNKEIKDNILKGIPDTYELSELKSGLRSQAFENDLYVLKLFFSEESDYDSKAEGTLYWVDYAGKESFYPFNYSNVIELYSDDIKSIWFDEKTAGMLDHVDLYSYNADDYYNDVVDAIYKIKEYGMENINETDYEINGIISVPSNGIFATSVPFDENWEIYIDDEKKEVIKVNTGFVGSRISAGKHRIRMYYKHDTWFCSNKGRIIVFWVVVIGLVFSGIRNINFDFIKKFREVKEHD